MAMPRTTGLVLFWDCIVSLFGKVLFKQSHINKKGASLIRELVVHKDISSHKRLVMSKENALFPTSVVFDAGDTTSTVVALLSICSNRQSSWET